MHVPGLQSAIACRACKGHKAHLIPPDERASNGDANALYKVPQDMDDGAPQVDAVRIPSMLVAVTVAVPTCCSTPMTVFMGLMVMCMLPRFDILRQEGTSARFPSEVRPLHLHVLCCGDAGQGRDWPDCSRLPTARPQCAAAGLEQLLCSSRMHPVCRCAQEVLLQGTSLPIQERWHLCMSHPQSEPQMHPAETAQTGSSLTPEGLDCCFLPLECPQPPWSWL